MLETLDHIYSVEPHKAMIHDESISEMLNLHHDLTTSSLSVIICANEQLERQKKGYLAVNSLTASNDLLAACKDKHENLGYLHNKANSASDINGSEIATNSDENTLTLYLGGKGNISNQLDTHTRHVILANGQRKDKRRENTEQNASSLYLSLFLPSFLPSFHSRQLSHFILLFFLSLSLSSLSLCI